MFPEIYCFRKNPEKNRSEGFCLFNKEPGEGCARLLHGGRRLFDHFTVGVFAIGQCRVFDRLAEVLVAFGAVLSCEAANVAPLKSVQGFDSGESCDTLKLFAFFDKNLK